MEPTLVTSPNLLTILDELMHLEEIFHHPGPGMTRADFERMTEPDFWEVGASGRRYNRDFVSDVLEDRVRHPDRSTWETRDGHCAEIAPDNFLLTYTLIQGDRVTRRMTIWRRSATGWKTVYHQGTTVANV
ncbi:MAG TPA: DUF4440 domain-containing protein [Bacteroidota bacterium]|nr:DUF4440 domain-containing protein [Bacteroidota bacterium]